MHVPEQDVLALLRMSEVLVEKADAAFDGSVCSRKSLHKAEQVRLLTRLAADSVARRGELAALKFGDLDGRVLTIERGVSGEEIGPTKTKRTRRLTLGRTTVELWRASEADLASASEGASFGEWVFSPGHRPPTAPHGQRHGPLVRRAVRRGGPGRGQPPPAAPLRGHLPGGPG
jgi:integrase